MRYLADSSIWAWATGGSRPDVAEKLAHRLERGEIRTCPPVCLEVMHRAESGEKYDSLFGDLLAPLERLLFTAEASERALQVQREHAATSSGNHRRPGIDFLIAAVAESAGDDVVLWFFDRDLRVICEHTEQAFEAEESTGPGH